MKVLAAYLLLVLGGNEAPDAAAVSDLLSKSGVEVDADAVAKVVEGLAGKDLNELIEAGSKKLLVGGGGGGGGGAAAGAAAGGAAPAEEKEEEKAEPAAVDMGGGDLFGDDDGY